MRRIQELVLLGGYKLKEQWARGCIAGDWRTQTLKMVGNVHSNNVLTFDLKNAPPLETFPEIYPVKVEPGWWPTHKNGADHQYANGLWFDGSRYWAVCRAHYDTAPTWNMMAYADDGDIYEIPLEQQKFSGFVKPPVGDDGVSWAYFGCGGYESGQGTCSGPTLADCEGNIFLQYADFNLENPGPNLEYWNLRAPRLPDHFTYTDSWLAWNPREVNGVLEGRWASDWLYGGGVILPDGPLCYFPYQGTGELRYSWGENPDGSRIQRTITFAEQEWYNRSCLLAYDPATFECVEFGRLLDSQGPVCGQELDPEGRLWLAQSDWTPDNEIQLRVYQVNYKK